MQAGEENGELKRNAAAWLKQPAKKQLDIGEQALEIALWRLELRHLEVGRKFSGSEWGGRKGRLSAALNRLGPD
jgi:hypothetical protein